MYSEKIFLKNNSAFVLLLSRMHAFQKQAMNGTTVTWRVVLILDYNAKW